MAVIRPIAERLIPSRFKPTEGAAPLATAAKAPREFDNLVTMLDQSIAERGDARLFRLRDDATGTWNDVSYKQFGEQVEKARGGLAKLGVKAGDRVAIISDNNLEWAVTNYAAYQRGAAVVPMFRDQMKNPDVIAHILKDSGANVVFAETPAVKDALLAMRGEDADLRTQIPPRKIVTFEGEGPGSFQKLLADGEASPVDAIVPNTNDLASIVYTSGTTGAPKGVAATHRNLAASVRGLLSAVPIPDSFTSLNKLPWNHVAGQVSELHGLIAAGASTAVFRGANDQLIKQIAEVKPEILFGVPAIWDKIYDGAQSKIKEPLGVITSRAQKAQKAIDAHETAAADGTQEVSAAPKLTLADRVSMMVARQKMFQATNDKFSGSLKKLVDSSIESQRTLDQGKSIGIKERAARRAADALVFSKVRDGLGGNVTLAASGAAKLGDQTRDFFRTAFAIAPTNKHLVLDPRAIVDGYGMSETTSAVMMNPIGDPAHQRFLKPLPGIEARLSPEGELQVRGAQTETHYWNNPEKTAELFTEDGWLKTGDLASENDGLFQITGRAKDSYKLGNGQYVQPVEVEEKLARNPAIEQAVLYGNGHKYNVAVVVPSKAFAESWGSMNGMAGKSVAEICQKPEFKAAVKAEVDRTAKADVPVSYERPRDIMLRADPFTFDNGLMTNTLKVKRAKVIEAHQAELEAMYPAGD